MARELTVNERALLEWLLRDASVSGATQLRAQIPFTRVVEGVPSLPTYLHLSVSGAAPAECEDGPLPGGAMVEDPSGQPAGFLEVWVKDGYLDAVEHSWVTQDMPEALPAVGRLREWRPEEDHQHRARTRQ